jgi:hypothetical protein
MAEKCLIGYKRGIIDKSTLVIGDIFDKIVPCCDKFNRWFDSTGPRKRVTFNQPAPQDMNGLNLAMRGGSLKLIFRLELSLRILMTDEMKFCPFCGAEIEVKCTKSVTLKEKTKEIFDGYDEEITWKMDEPSAPATDEAPK